MWKQNEDAVLKIVKYLEVIAGRGGVAARKVVTLRRK
jgi:hypothetical protein